jgi:hypothetical protein
MDRPQKSLVRLALAIHRLLASPSSPNRMIELPAGSWQRATDLVRQIRRAELQFWHLAAATLREDLRGALTRLQSQLIELERSLSTSPPSSYRERPTDIYRDLVSLENHFESMSFDVKFHHLSVTTEPITLEGHYLGLFEIRLDLRRLAAESPYRVIALDPHPAASREGVTHPHVSDEVPCEGDGRTAIRQALAQGRLLDFFQLVVSLLRTYNRESPFVELALWNGESCGDCGETVTAEYRYECQRCEDTVCSECQSTCGACEGSFCSSCICKCAICHDAYCGSCLSGCAACPRVVCSNCLDEHERCPHCHEEKTSQSPDAAAETADPAVHTHGLGQTPLPA